MVVIQMMLGNTISITVFQLEDHINLLQVVNHIVSHHAVLLVKKNPFYQLLLAVINVLVHIINHINNHYILEAMFIMLIVMFQLFNKKLWLTDQFKPLWMFIKILWPIKVVFIHMLLVHILVVMPSKLLVGVFKMVLIIG